MKQRGALLVSAPPNTTPGKTNADSEDCGDQLAPARGIVNALGLTAMAAIPFAVFLLIVVFG